MVRRLVLLFLAAVIAAAGTGAVFMYARGADKRAIDNTKPVTVLVAQNAIAPGTTGAAAAAGGAFVLKELPITAIALGALQDSASINDKVALGPIVPGQQIVSALWGDTSSYSQLQIPSGQMAVSVQLTDPGRVAGFVTPGSHVAIFVDAKPEELSTGGAAAPVAGSTQPPVKLPQFVRLLMPNVTVLASGPTTLLPQTKVADGTTQTDQVPKAILTVAVDQKDAQRLIFGAQHGTLYMALLRDDSKIVPSGPITGDELWPAGSAG